MEIIGNPYIEVDDFVTASLISDKNKIRQGVVTQVFNCGVLFVKGESGEEYVCSAVDSVIVPKKNLFF